MDGWMDGWTDGRTDGWMDGWIMGGWMNGVCGCRGENPKDLQFNTSHCLLILIISFFLSWRYNPHCGLYFTAL